MHYHGMVGVTPRGPDPYGCICHGLSVPTDTVVVTITGPDTVIAGSSNLYTITMTGGPAVEGGFDLSVGCGEVYPADTTTQRLWNYFTKFELTHLVPKAYDSGAVSWIFTYQAPAYSCLDTMYSVGNSTNDDESPAFDQYNFGNDFLVTVIDTSPLNSFPVKKGWNLVSLSVEAGRKAKSNLYPASSSNAYSYVSNAGYVSKDTLASGRGYWLKFDNAENPVIQGFSVDSLTVDVSAGWNLIGTINTPLYTGDITSNPPSIVTSQFYQYDAGYKNADTLKPAQGYWVKVSEAGTLTLSHSIVTSQSRIKVITSSELPPPPPETVNNNNTIIPGEYALEQNYPNPFNPSTVIHYQIPDVGTQRAVSVKLNVYNTLGELIATLVDGNKEPGNYTVEFTPNNLTSGIYFYQLQTPGHTETRKMIFSK